MTLHANGRENACPRHNGTRRGSSCSDCNVREWEITAVEEPPAAPVTSLEIEVAGRRNASHCFT